MVNAVVKRWIGMDKRRQVWSKEDCVSAVMVAGVSSEVEGVAGLNCMLPIEYK